MLATFVILFREVLEIALILSVVMAATQALPGRGRWVWAGLAGGVAGSVLIALGANQLSSALEGTGQEIFNAAVLIAAVAMIAWTVVWMQRHAKQLTRRLKEVGQAVTLGHLPLYSLSVIVSLAMWREGAEIVLFMAGLLRTSQESLFSIAAGATAGVLTAGVLGALFYWGLIRLPVRRMFLVTGWLLVLLACGMSAQAANYLVQAGWLPELAAPLWDSSFLVADGGIIGRFLHALLGYTARPSAMQLLWYAATFATLLFLMHAFQEKHTAAVTSAA